MIIFFIAWLGRVAKLRVLISTRKLGGYGRMWEGWRKVSRGPGILWNCLMPFTLERELCRTWRLAEKPIAERTHMYSKWTSCEKAAGRNACKGLEGYELKWVEVNFPTEEA